MGRRKTGRYFGKPVLHGVGDESEQSEGDLQGEASGTEQHQNGGSQPYNTFSEDAAHGRANGEQ